MPTTRTDSDSAQTFIARWKSSGGAERANYQMFLTELCDPLDNRDGTTTTGFIDLYRRQHFVCETKQGVERGAPENAEKSAVLLDF